MFEKMIGVSPPQKGKAQDSKVNAKDFRDTAESKSAYKSDFERALKQKEERQKENLDKKHELAKKEESRADKKDKKSSGGIKKKMTDVDDKMVSKVMASKENEVETPDSKEQEPAEIEVENKAKTEKPQKVLNLLDSGALAGKTLEEDKKAQAGLSENEVKPQAKAEANSFDAELGEAVGLKQNPNANKELLNKLKAFEGESKNANEAKSSSFEKNVLAQLQKDGAFNSNSSSQGDQSGASFEQKNKSDLKSELMGNQLHTGATPLHSQFKSELAAAGAGALKTENTASLEAHREANINEIMSKAQYLVHKGGGEVSVKMSPEGMGEVHLKVQLLDGKLNVEMQTADKNVKKLIEESLSDLKSGLAAHRLSLEHVKIDTVNATNTDNNAQMQSNLHQGGGESRSRDFWSEAQSQMNQGAQKRSATSEGSQSSSRSTAATGAATSSQPMALRTYGGTKGATVNRVA
ncbi:MAG: flagellar hook-length control protein FliK [Pseudobdellovibrio sp.]